MSGDYRDPLAAALSRVEALERQNAALKDAQSGRPATVGELEVVRLENELFRLDTEWTAETTRKYGGPMAAKPDERGRRRQLTILTAMMLVSGLVFSMSVFMKRGALAGVVSALVMVAFVVGTRWIRTSGDSRVARDWELHAKRRESLVRQIAALRGEPHPVGAAASPTVRVAELDEAEMSAEDAPSAAAKRT